METRRAQSYEQTRKLRPTCFARVDEGERELACDRNPNTYLQSTCNGVSKIDVATDGEVLNATYCIGNVMG